MTSNDPLRNLPIVTPPRPGEKRARPWQIAATAIAAIAVIALVLYGLNSQRGEGEGGAQTAATQVTPPGGAEQPAQARQQAAPNAGQSKAPATTGQGGDNNGAAPSGGGAQQQGRQPANAAPDRQQTQNPGPAANRDAQQ